MKKGFTLVELLAVIVILAIILAIAIPSITGIIRNTTKNAFLSDAKMVIKAIDYKLLENEDFDVTTIKKDAEADTVSSELKLSTDNYESVSVAIDEFGKTNIMIVGQNKWDGLTAYGTFNSMTVVDNADAPGSYYCAIELGNAVVGDVLSGKTFTNGDGLQTGTMPNRIGNIEASSISLDGTTLRFEPPQGYYPGDATNNITYTDPDFISGNIKEGVNIFGVEGTLNPFPSIIESIQSGSVSISELTEINISSIDINKSKLVLNGRGYCYIDTDSSQANLPIGRILDSNTIELRPSRNGCSLYVTWQVIEYKPEVIKSVQRGILSPGSTGTTDVTINSVNVDKSELLVYGGGFYDDSNHDNNAVSTVNGRLTSSTNLQLNYWSDSITITWEVLEYN